MIKMRCTQSTTPARRGLYFAGDGNDVAGAVFQNRRGKNLGRWKVLVRGGGTKSSPEFGRGRIRGRSGAVEDRQRLRLG
jgi:hypothetical protein